MSYHEILQSLLPSDEWEVNSFGDGFICPCGNEIEMDGCCPEGHESPMLTAGLI